MRDSWVNPDYIQPVEHLDHEKGEIRLVPPHGEVWPRRVLVVIILEELPEQEEIPRKGIS